MFIRKLLSISCLIGCVFNFCRSKNSIKKIESLKFNNIQANDEDKEIVFGYEDILKTYYNLGVGDSLNPSKTFEQFFDSFYEEGSSRNLVEFTLELAEENDNLQNVYNIIYRENNISTISSSSSSGDADYILKNIENYQFTTKNSFSRTPFYSIYNYSSIKQGDDIVWETETIFNNAGHNALITDLKHKSSYGNYIETIEAVGGGVQYGFIDDVRITAYKCKILRVKGSDKEKVDKAVYFAWKQVGKRYNLNIFRLNTDINSNEWYCSELVYACWKYAGIDINGRNNAGNNHLLGCLPVDINNSSNTTELTVQPFDYLYLYNVKFSKNVWSFYFFNNNSHIISDIFYTGKMCNYKSLVKEKWFNLNKITNKREWNENFNFKKKLGNYQPYTGSEIGIKKDGDNNSFGIYYHTEHSVRYIIYSNISENGPLSIYEKRN